MPKQRSAPKGFLPPVSLPLSQLTNTSPGASVNTVSVSNDSAAGYDPSPNWPALRLEYEGANVSLRKLASLRNVSPSTMMKRAMREKWNQRARIIRKAAAGMEADAESLAVAEIRKELAPWIEEQKTKITKEGVAIYKRGVGRIKKIWNDQLPNDTKSEAEASKAAETLFRIGRTALGMGDGTSVGGSIQLNILTNNAAIQVRQPVS